MEQLLKEYFKFNGKGKKDIKIIDELNPIKIIKKNIYEFTDNNLYKNKINEESIKEEFNINYDVYEKIITSVAFGDYINSDYLKILVVELLNKYMITNKIPIIGKYNSIIYKLYKNNKLHDKKNKEVDIISYINQDYGILLYNIIIENKMTNILELGFGSGSSGLFISTALKNLELYDYKTNYTAVDPDQKNKWNYIGETSIEKIGYKNMDLIEKPYNLALPNLLNDISNKKSKLFDMIFINGLYTFDYKLEVYYADLLLKNDGYLIIYNNMNELAVLKKYLSNNYNSFQILDNVLNSMIIYKKI